MKIRVDVCINEGNVVIDSSFLERRKLWLSGMGVYLEFILKGEYFTAFDFEVVSSGEGIVVSRHSWNRFFLNIKSVASVIFRVKARNQVVSEKEIKFDVVSTDIPLLFSIPYLCKYPMTDIRFFANRLSENLVNGTRFNLFTPKVLNYLSKVEMSPEPDFWKMHELILSILTERGLSVYISPFDEGTPYTIPMIKAFKSVLFEYAERNLKFNLVWDLSGGIWKKGIIGVTDSFYSKFGHNIRIATSPEMVQSLGGEGFVQVFIKGDMRAEMDKNETGVKILRIFTLGMDFFELRKFASSLVDLNWGLECVMKEDYHTVKRIQYSLGNAMYKGYLDSKKGKDATKSE